MLSEIMARLKGKKVPTARDLEAALAKIDLAALGEVALRAEAERREALLAGAPDDEIDRLEAQMIKARMGVERGQIAKDELTVRLGEALEREARDELDRDLAALDAEARKKAREVAEMYERAGTEIIAGLAALEALSERVRALNERLVEAGRDDERIPAPDQIAFGCFANYADNVTSVHALTSLRPAGAMPGCGAGTQTFTVLGVEASAAKAV